MIDRSYLIYRKFLEDSGLIKSKLITTITYIFARFLMWLLLIKWKKMIRKAFQEL